MIEFTVDVRELEALADKVPGMRQAVEEEIERAMEEAGMLLTTMVAGRTPVNYGILRASIEFPQGFTVRGTPATVLQGVVAASDQRTITGVSTAMYANHVEFGTRPHWPPIAPLKLWAIRKLGDETAAYPVAAAIARRGTPGAHMFQRAWNEGGERKVQEVFDRATVRAVKRMGA